MDETIKRALCGELSYEELCALREKKIPRGDYYDYDVFRSVILRKVNGEISDKLFNEWLYFVMMRLDDDRYYDLADTFDAFVFYKTYDRKCALKLMALLKAFDYELRHKDYMKDHEKEGLRVVYLRFQHCNWTEDSCVYKAYFVDYKERRFDIRLIDDAFFEYNDDVLYCMIDAYPDGADESEELEEPYETWQEEYLLTNHFYNEKEKWTYDHSLSF